MIRKHKPTEEFSFWDHADELRSRLIKVIVVFIFFSIFSYFFTDPVLAYLAQPVGKFIFISLTEAFEVRISLALWGGFFLSLPFIFFQIWQFIVLGLKRHEQKIIFILSFLSVGLFMAGAIFAYRVLIVFGVKFFLSFSCEYLVPLLTVKQYLSLVGFLMVTCGIMFQLPLVILFLTSARIITPVFLIQRRKEAIVIMLFVSAVVTPQTDIMTQLMVFLPLMGLYEISIIGAKYVFSKRL